MTADNKDCTIDDPTDKRYSFTINKPIKRTRASTRIRKQRIVAQLEYSDEEDDPYADNSDVDSNYSEYICSNRIRQRKDIKVKRPNRTNMKRKRRKKSRPNDLLNNNFEENETIEKENTQVCYRVTRSGGTVRELVPKSGKNRKIPDAKGIQHNDFNRTDCQTTSTSIPRLNKNGLTRGKNDTKVDAASHWRSLDNNFMAGKFVMYKRDKPLLNSINLSIWRISNKSLLQKFEAFFNEDAEGRSILFKAVKVYGSWSPLRIDDYVIVPVNTPGTMSRETTSTSTSTTQNIVQIDTSHSIDIDSDE